MVDIELQSIKKVIVHEVVEHTVKDLVKIRTTGMPKEAIVRPFRWVEGVLFSSSPMPPTNEVIKQQLEGIIHLLAVEWALMPKYKKYLRRGGITISVVDASGNPTLIELAKELKKSHKKT